MGNPWTALAVMFGSVVMAGSIGGAAFYVVDKTTKNIDRTLGCKRVHANLDANWTVGLSEKPNTKTKVKKRTIRRASSTARVDANPSNELILQVDTIPAIRWDDTSAVPLAKQLNIQDRLCSGCIHHLPDLSCDQFSGLLSSARCPLSL